MSIARVRKAVLPAAGLGTRLLPLTKAIPKEMLPIGSKPLIQYAVDEAVSSGIEEIILVVAARDRILREYFRRDAGLERILEQRGRHLDSQRLRTLCASARFRFVEQENPLGLGHAIACARKLVGNEPFAVILPDALIRGSSPCLGQLMEARERNPGCYIATREVPVDDLCRFGILEVQRSGPETTSSSPSYRIVGLEEKPDVGAAPSRLGVFGRYLLEPRIFDYIEKTRPDARGEIQMTSALADYCRDFPVYGYLFAGEHYDAGNWLGLAQASSSCTLEDSELGNDFRKFLISALSSRS